LRLCGGNSSSRAIAWRRDFCKSRRIGRCQLLGEKVISGEMLLDIARSNSVLYISASADGVVFRLSNGGHSIEQRLSITQIEFARFDVSETVVREMFSKLCSFVSVQRITRDAQTDLSQQQ
jgi:hypothetical protein